MRSDVSILLVEDDALDVKNVKRAFAERRISNKLFVVSDGEEALAFLRHEPPFADAEAYPRPGIILLDLNLPLMNGLSFLATYKNDPDLRRIPSVVLTTSDEESDRVRSYSVGIAGYIVKPVDFSKFVEAIQNFDLYWTLCELPLGAPESTKEPG